MLCWHPCHGGAFVYYAEYLQYRKYKPPGFDYLNFLKEVDNLIYNENNSLTSIRMIKAFFIEPFILLFCFYWKIGETVEEGSVEKIHEQKVPGLERPGSLFCLAGDRHTDGHVQAIENAATQHLTDQHQHKRQAQ